jgi:SAM-dependent methyltransferase
VTERKQASLGDVSDRSWESHGRHQAYYGVLSIDKFRTENLTESVIAEFMESGVDHVARILSVAEKNFGPVTRGRALDFGCGVGRLLLPLARQFNHATGLDISDSMLAETRRNAERFGLSNIALFHAPEEIPASEAGFDFIHSVIVFQHIPVERGEKIIAALLQRLAPGGVAALHINLRTHQSWWRRLGSRLRKHLTPLNILANLANRRPWNEAMMQMNEYRLDRIFELVTGLGFGRMLVEPSGDAKASQAFIFVRKD